MHKIFNFDHFVFLGVLFFLPFGKSFFLPVLFIWLCFVIISYFIKGDYSFARLKGLLILPIILYLLYAVAIAMSTDLKGCLSEFKFRIPLLLIPMLYPYQRESYISNSRGFLLSFVIGCTSASIFYFCNAIYRSYSFVNNIWVFNPIPSYGWNNYFLSDEFSTLIHPSYLALYILVALLIIGVELNTWWKKRITIKFALILSILLLVSCLILLQSRAGIFSFGLLSVVWLLYIVIARRNYIIGAGIVVAIFCFTYFVFTKFDRFANTAKSFETTAKVGINNQTKEDGTAIRFWIWKSALSVIKEHPIFGVGPTTVKDVLYNEYIKRDMKAAASVKLNAHNQYLETWLGVGIFGLLMLLATLIAPLWFGVKKQEWLLVGFICLISLSFIFESMFERTPGIVFFAIFYTTLVNLKSKSDIVPK